MNDDKWQDILGKIEADFEIQRHDFEELSDIPNAKAEILIFESPLGQMKIIRTTKPRVLETKTQFSNRAGSNVSVDKVYSEDEFVNDLEIYKWDDIENDWVKADFNI